MLRASLPPSTKSFVTVFFATPVMRMVARMEVPSTRAFTTWTRLAWESRFI
ncbi:MAG: hypothetical protein ACYDC5_10085 [Candidatus Dormibacteria bacterium]